MPDSSERDGGEISCADEPIQSSFDEYWMEYGVKFSYELFDFILKNGGPYKYLRPGAPTTVESCTNVYEKEVLEFDISAAIIGYWEHLFEPKPTPLMAVQHDVIYKEDTTTDNSDTVAPAAGDATPPSIEALFDDFWDDPSNCTARSSAICGSSDIDYCQIWSIYSWTIFNLLKKKFEEVSKYLEEGHEEQITPEHDSDIESPPSPHPAECGTRNKQSTDEDSMLCGEYALFDLIENFAEYKKQPEVKSKKRKRRVCNRRNKKHHQYDVSRTISSFQYTDSSEIMNERKSGSDTSCLVPSTRSVALVDVSEMNEEIQKYYSQRYRLFSRYDQGIMMDREGWFSVTIEKIAIHHARRCACDVICDPFCGCGGNVIQFATTCNFVAASDHDIQKLMLARHNAGVYGVSNKIDFFLADCRYAIECIRGDVLFMSTPWGGPSYLQLGSYCVETMMQPPASELFSHINSTCHSVVMYLPRNVLLKPLLELSRGFGDTMELEQNAVNKKVKSKTAYFGRIAKKL